MKITTFLFFSLNLLALNLYAQKNTPTPSITDTIPFTLTEFNNISIQAILNGEDTLDLMFHTAVSSVSLTSKAIEEKIKSLVITDSANVQTWGGSSKTGYSRSNTLQIAHLSWDSIGITESMHSGKLTDGKFGPNLFQSKILEIDFDHRRLVLHETLPELNNYYEQLDLEINNESMYLIGKVKIGNAVLENKFMIHSGYGGSLLLDDEFVNSNELAKKLEVIGESQLKDSHGNILVTKKVILPQLSFGNTAFSDLPVSIFDGAIGRQRNSVLGGDLIKRFNYFIDFDNAQIYLKPNALFALDFQS